MSGFLVTLRIIYAEKNDLMKNILLYITGIFILLTMSMTSGCGSGEPRPDVADSIYSVEYIYSITIDNPERALALLDIVEQKYLLSKFANWK